MGLLALSRLLKDNAGLRDEPKGRGQQGLFRAALSFTCRISKGCLLVGPTPAKASCAPRRRSLARGRAARGWAPFLVRRERGAFAGKRARSANVADP